MALNPTPSYSRQAGILRGEGWSHTARGTAGPRCWSPTAQTCHVHNITPMGVGRWQRGGHGPAILGSQVPGPASPQFPSSQPVPGVHPVLFSGPPGGGTGLWDSGPRRRKGVFVGTELVSAIHGSLTTDYPPSLGSQNEPHSPPHRKHGSCSYSFLFLFSPLPPKQGFSV